MDSAGSLVSIAPANLVLITLVFVLAGVVKGVVGLGLPTISMALLALMMMPAQAAALLVVPSLVTNIWQLQPWSALGPMLKRLGLMQLGIWTGTLAGAWVFGVPAGPWPMVCLGAALIIYAAWGLSGAKLFVSPIVERWLGPVVGAATGLVTAVTGVFVIPAVPYLQSLALHRDEMIQAMGLSFTVSTMALATGLYFHGRYTTELLGVSCWLLLPALAGMAIGQLLRQSLSLTTFRRCFFSSLLCLGVHMIWSELPR